MKLMATFYLNELILLSFCLWIYGWGCFGLLGWGNSLKCDADLAKLTDPDADRFTTVFVTTDTGANKMRPMRDYFPQDSSNRFVDGDFVYSVVLENLDLSQLPVTAVCTNPVIGEDRVRGSFNFYEGNQIKRTSSQGVSNWNPEVSLSIVWRLLF